MKKLIGVVFIVALLVIAGFIVFREPAPKRIAANLVFKETGIYRSPVGDCLVDISVVEGGKLKFLVYRQNKIGRNGTGPGEPFTADSDWFMCWDSQGRLWAYVPERDLEHCSHWYGTGSRRVGNYGWDGVPEAFVERLPTAVKEKYNTYIKSHKK
jgi:hypothetical protein